MLKKFLNLSLTIINILCFSKIAQAQIPQKAIDYYHRGIDRANQGDLIGAVADYTMAINLNPQDPAPWSNRCRIKWQLRDYLSAEADCTEAIKLRSNYANAYYNRGLIRRDQDKLNLACNDFQTAADLYRGQDKLEDAQDVRAKIMEINDPPYPPLVLSIHRQINQYRKSRNLPSLELSPIISTIAQKHSQEMLLKDDLNHDGFDQRAQIIKQSITFDRMAENVAYNEGYSQPDLIAINGWIESPGHQRNLIGNYNLTGIGIAEKNGKYYFTQIFINQVNQRF